MNSTAPIRKFASYKARSYRLMFLGDTKFGRRARLAFMDGSKEFWVAADQVVIEDAPSPARRRVRSNTGGRARSNYDGQMCPACGSEELDERLSCWECGFQGQ